MDLRKSGGELYYRRDYSAHLNEYSGIFTMMNISVHCPLTEGQKM